jgi:hypothetical protein
MLPEPTEAKETVLEWKFRQMYLEWDPPDVLKMVRLECVCFASVEVSEGESFYLGSRNCSVDHISGRVHLLAIEPYFMDSIALSCKLSAAEVSAAQWQLGCLKFHLLPMTSPGNFHYF